MTIVVRTAARIISGVIPQGLGLVGITGTPIQMMEITFNLVIREQHLEA
jgi:hypothetical protein